MKLQSASRKEVARMASGCGVCAVLEIAAFVLLHVCGIGSFSYQIITGTIGGTLVAIVNYAMMCLMIQNAVGIQDQKLLKAKVRSSYNLRILFQSAWVAAAFFIPFINVIAAAIPLLFPTAVIYFLQITGRLVPKEKAPSPVRPSQPEEEEPEDHLNSFEV